MSVQALRVHVSLNVADVSQSIEFYRKMFGAEPVRVRPRYAKFDITNPPINLALNEVAITAVQSHEGALSHLGIQVGSTDDVMAMRQSWIDAGLITRDEMKTDCCYASQDKTWVHDPDGNQWEAFVVLGESDQMTSAASTCCISVPASAAAEPVAETKSETSCCVDADGGDPAVTGKDCACACAS